MPGYTQTEPPPLVLRPNRAREMPIFTKEEDDDAFERILEEAVERIEMRLGEGGDTVCK